jgi:tetratricopeptide (TPR) repeat protein
VGAVAGGAAALFTTPAPADAAPPVAVPDDDPEVVRRMSALEAAVDAQGEELARLGRTFEARLEGLSRRPVVADAVAAPEAAVDEPAAAAEVPEGPLDAATLFERLLAADDGEADALWQRARELGLTDELLALFEERAASDPNDPELQLELGVAYIEKLQEAGQSAMAGKWATMADEAFDRALELNPDHWEARMYKAVSLSFWPPIFGKQKEAVAQFELLIANQKTLPPSPEHANPYVMLGNLHWQRGDTEAALAVWQEGHGLFPDSTELADKLAGSE